MNMYDQDRVERRSELLVWSLRIGLFFVAALLSALPSSVQAQTIEPTFAITVPGITAECKVDCTPPGSGQIPLGCQHTGTCMPSGPELFEIEGERNDLLLLQFTDAADEAQYEFNFFRLDPTSEYAAPLATDVVLEARSNAQYSFGEIPASQPGGQFLIVACAPEECDIPWLSNNLTSTEVAAQFYELSPLVGIADKPRLRPDALNRVDVSLQVDENLSASDVVSFQLNVNDEPLDYTTEPLRNFTQPYLEVDLENEIIRLYPRGAYLKQQMELVAPAWVPIFFGSEELTLPSGRYQLSVLTNQVIESFTEFEIPPIMP